MKHLREYRAERLRELAQKAGGKAALGRLLGYKDGAFVGQMLRGERPISEKTIALINSMSGFEGWFDKAESAATEHRASPKRGITEPLTALASALESADDLTVEQARVLLTKLIDAPDRAREIIPRLAALLD